MFVYNSYSSFAVIVPGVMSETTGGIYLKSNRPAVGSLGIWGWHSRDLLMNSHL